MFSTFSAALWFLKSAATLFFIVQLLISPYDPNLTLSLNPDGSACLKQTLIFNPGICSGNQYMRTVWITDVR